MRARSFVCSASFALFALFALFAAAAVGPKRAAACPACNIHNYLAAHLPASTKVFTARILKATGEHEAELEVVKVLRGPLAPGDITKATAYDAKDHIGETLLFSNGRLMGPSFPVLPLVLEREARFLLRGVQKKLPKDAVLLGPPPAPTPKTRDLAEAVRAVQGVSSTTRYAGMEVLRKHRGAATEAVIAELRRTVPRLVAGTLEPYGHRRIDGLVEALALHPKGLAGTFLLAEAQAQLDRPPRELDWSRSDLGWAAPRAHYLASILTRTKSEPKLCAALQAIIEARLLTASPDALADAVYALVRSEAYKPEALASGPLKQLDSDARRDAAALGLYQHGWLAGRWWQR